jgi:hypothetical protein
MEIQMKTKTIITGLILTIYMFTGTLFADNTQHLSLQIGQKILKESDWTPIEDQIEVGISFDASIYETNNYIALSFLNGLSRKTYSTYYYGDYEKILETREYRIGYRRYANISDKVSFFCGIGGQYSTVKISTEYSSITNSTDEDTYGLYIEIAETYKITDNFAVGLKVDYSKAKIKTKFNESEIGGIHYGLLSSFEF